PARDVEFDTAYFDHARSDGLIPELKLNARDQFADEERLDYIVVGAKLQPHNPIGLRRAGSQKNDGGGRQIGGCADGPANLQTVGIGQHDVEKDQVGALLPACIQSALACEKTDKGVTFFGEIVLQQ